MTRSILSLASVITVPLWHSFAWDRFLKCFTMNVIYQLTFAVRLKLLIAH